MANGHPSVAAVNANYYLFMYQLFDQLIKETMYQHNNF